MDHTLFARIEMLRASMLVVSIEVDGMKAANAHNIANQQTLQYHEGNFADKAMEVRGIIDELHALTY